MLHRRDPQRDLVTPDGCVVSVFDDHGRFEAVIGSEIRRLTHGDAFPVVRKGSHARVAGAISAELGLRRLCGLFAAMRRCPLGAGCFVSGGPPVLFAPFGSRLAAFPFQAALQHGGKIDDFGGPTVARIDIVTSIVDRPRSPVCFRPSRRHG